MSGGLLEGRVAFVTGGSRGLGRALCVEAAREGAAVVFNYARDEEAAAACAREVAALGGRVLAIKCDMLDRAGLEQLVKRAEAELGVIDILINNAGVGQVVPLALMEEADWDRVLDINVKGVFLASKAVLRGMVRLKRGRILNIGSLAGVKMMLAPVHYSASKGALKGFTESLAKEVGRYGILVNLLAPGILDEGISHNVPKSNLEDYLHHCSLGRLGKLEEAAAVAVLLLANRNTYMSGATVVLDGAV